MLTSSVVQPWVQRLLATVGLAVLWCFWRRWHNPIRHILGGHRCADCNAALADLEEAGTIRGRSVNPLRWFFDRKDGGTFTKERR